MFFRRSSNLLLRSLTRFPISQRMNMATEIVWATDRLRLFNQLESRDEHETFPVRHMLWLISTNVIKEGKVYVDQWPDFRHICCLHPTKLYAVASDRDFATVASSGLEIDAQTYSKSLRLFLQALVKEREWKSREGVILFYVTDPVVRAAQDILCRTPNAEDGNFWLSQPLRHFIASKPENMAEYERRRQDAFTKIDPTLVIDRVRPEDVSIIAQNWHYNLPDKEAMFSWLVSILPSVCIRQPGTLRPLTWVLAYSCGASGAAFVIPERRGRGLAEAQTFQLTVELSKLIPSKRFFWILDDNVASLKNAAKIYFDWERTDLFVHIFVYDAPKKTPAEKAKL